MFTLLLALSCASPDVPLTGDDLPDDGGTDDDGTGDDGGGSTGDDGGEDEPPEHVGSSVGDKTRKRTCEGLYDPDALLELSLDMPDSSWSGLRSDFSAGNKGYHPAQLTWGEETVDAQVRLKGNPSFSWLGDKMQFVVSFNEEDPDARFHGVRKIALDSTWYEPTMLRDRLAWAILREVEGMPAACANSARLDINGEYYGLFTNIEYFDHEWLEETFGDDHADGTLWKYGTEAKTNEDLADTDKVGDYFNASSVADLEQLGNPGQWLQVWAAEAVLGDDDGYWCCAHNFYIYEHPTRDLVFVPWDLDDLFDVTPYDLDPIEGYPNNRYLFSQRPFTLLEADATWGPAYRESLAEVTAAMDADIWVPRLQTWAAQIADAVEEDPNRSIGVEEHQAAVVRMTDYLVAREAFLQSWLACEAGGTTDADGDGAAVCVDPDDGDGSIHPGADEQCNGRDNDANGIIDDDLACEDCARHDFEDEAFLFCRTPRTWEDAQANCERQGATLSLFRTTPEFYIFYWYTWPVFEGWWLGATDEAKQGTWVDPDGNSVASYVYWASGQPNGGASQDCAAFHPSYSAWVDEDCADEHPSVCRL